MVEALCLFFPPLLSVFITVYDRIYEPAIDIKKFLLHIFFLFITFSVLNNILSLTIAKLLFSPGATFIQGHLAEPLISIKFLIVATLVAIALGVTGYVFLNYGSIQIKKKSRNSKTFH